MTVQEFYERIFLKYPHVSTDTRTIEKDSIFIALKGENFDGNQYALQALKQGAAYAVVEDASICNDRCVCVENTLKFLQDLAHYHRMQLNIPVIGITGTNGKTTTKELVSTVLAQKYKVEYTKGLSDVQVKARVEAGLANKARNATSTSYFEIFIKNIWQC